MHLRNDILSLHYFLFPPVAKNIDVKAGVILSFYETHGGHARHSDGGKAHFRLEDAFHKQELERHVGFVMEESCHVADCLIADKGVIRLRD